MLAQPPYLISSNNLKPFLEAIKRAQAPEKITLKFVEDLGFKSTNDRLLVPLLKSMKFADEAGKPTARYHAFLDDNESARVLADGIREAFPDLFRINKDANKLSRELLTGKLKSLSEGKLSPAVLGNIARTFQELVKHADFSARLTETDPTIPVKGAEEQVPGSAKPAKPTEPVEKLPLTLAGGTALAYRIEIVLPAVRDQAVYDAIFKSLRDHLLR
jgi:hypothetical protein